MMLTVATADDLAEVVSLANLAYRGAGEASGWNSEDGLLEGPRLTLAHLQEEIAAKPQAYLLLSRNMVDGALLATVWLEPMQENVWYLGLLTVRPDLQNQQHGRRLLEAAEVFALAHGARTLHMTVLHARDTLIAWYVRRGYVKTGETEPFPYHDERFGRPLRDDLHFLVLEKAI